MLVIPVFLLTLLSFPLVAKTIYVPGAAGKNNQPGTKEQPLKNIDKAIKIAQSGDTVNVAGGIYSGTFDIGYLDCPRFETGT
jgi:hypothetical protein